MRVDPKVDFAFKCLFGSEKRKNLLIALLKAILRINIDDVTILNPYNEKESPDDKLSILDVKARLSDGTFINIEMQITLAAGYAERSLYYWSVLYLDQLSEGEEYTELSPTVAIHIFNDVLFEEVPEYHVEFGIRAVEHPNLRLTDRFALHTIELPKMNLQVESLTSEMDSWCYFLKHAEDMDPNRLPMFPAHDPIRLAMEALNIMFQTERERDLYRGRLKQARDALWIQRASRKEGLEEGRQVGRQEGELIGNARGMQTAILELLDQKFGQAGSDLSARIRSVQDELRLMVLLRAAVALSSVEEYEKLL